MPLSLNFLLTAYQYLLNILILHRRLRARDEREYWVHPMNQTRESTSVVNRVQQLNEYPDRFYEQFRMSPATFHHLLFKLTPRISNANVKWVLVHRSCEIELGYSFAA